MGAVKEKSRLTIVDVADALGISKTTVSRAISGKGRIGEKTRERVLNYIEENHYQPSPLAKGLAKSKTYNICWAIPDDSTVTDAPFFLRCSVGIAKEASPRDYDILNALLHDGDIAQLKRIVDNRKVDGVILGRTLVKDKGIAFLKKSGIPFVVIGRTQEKDVIQIDNDHIRACREMTTMILQKGNKKLALVGGSLEHVVNQTRKRGFEAGLRAEGRSREEALYFLDCESREEIEKSVDKAVKEHADCLVCMDDRICYIVLARLHEAGIAVPGKIKVASFYNSQILGNHQPAITALEYDPKELGAVACRTLFQMMKGETVKEKVLLDYKVRITDSV